MTEHDTWIWGRHPVVEALRTRRVKQVLLLTGQQPAPALDEIRQLATDQNIPVHEVAPARINQLVGRPNTQGVVAQILRPSPMSLHELLKNVSGQSDPAFLVGLDQVQDPQNLGSLVRTAVAAGVKGMVVPERRSAPLSGTVSKISAGTIHHLPVVNVTNFVRALDEIREAGIWIVGLESAAKQTLYSIDLRMPVTIVVGGEEAGLRRLTREHCDFLASLPLLGPVESLNAAVAGAIALYEVVRQRQL